MEVNELVEEIAKSKKYANLSRDIIERVCAESAVKYKKKKAALSEVKKEFHIVYESFLTPNCQNIAKEKIMGYEGEDILADRKFCLELLPLHISTKERVGVEKEIYSFISQCIVPDGILSDVGCGFNPLALPFMEKRPGRYFAYEISRDTFDVLNVYFRKARMDGYTASILDAVQGVPSGYSDLLLALKLLPLLQQQKKGRAMEFLSEASFGTAVVSFPTKSMAGRNKGMEAYYTAFLEDNLPENILIADRRVIYNELFYVLKK